MTERDELIKDLEGVLATRSHNYLVQHYHGPNGYGSPQLKYDEGTTLLMRAVLLLLKTP